MNLEHSQPTMRYLILLSSVLMQMCLGATYSWSIFVQPIKLLSGLQQGPVQLPFTCFYFIFPLTMMFGGTILPRVGPRTSAMLGGLLFGGGWLLAGQGFHHFSFTVLGIGCFSGLGAGLAYIVPIAVCVSWFPKNKGLVTGVAVAGFGGGAALVSQIGGRLMESSGYSPFQTFSLFGIAFMIITVLAGSTMAFPKGNENSTPAETDTSLFRLARQPMFLFLYFSMFTGLAAGFAVNANLKELFTGGNGAAQTGIMAVSLFALANGLGRICWGILFDRIKTATAIISNQLSQTVVLLCLPLLISSTTGFLILAILSGFNYGGVLVIYVSSAGRFWGTEKIGQIYGRIFSSNIPASIAPMIAGIMYDRFQSFTQAFLGISLLLLITICIVFHQREAINQTFTP